MEGVGDVGTRSASTSAAEPDERCDKERSGTIGERRRKGSNAAAAEVEGPLIFSARSGESGSSTCGGVHAGDESAFISENARSSSSSSSPSPPSSPPDWSSIKGVNHHSAMNYMKCREKTHHRRREFAGGLGLIPAARAMEFSHQVSE